MSYGLQAGEATVIQCDPPLKVWVGTGIFRQAREWTHLLHTCHVGEQDPCLACGYRDCPKHEPHHYKPAGCPSCGVLP